MKKNIVAWVVFIIMMVLFAFATTPVSAQNVVRNGNCFVQSSKQSSTADTKTKYTYKAADGKVYPIYLSKNKKAYIIRVSKKTGNEYKQYLPEVTKQIAG